MRRINLKTIWGFMKPRKATDIVYTRRNKCSSLIQFRRELFASPNLVRTLARTPEEDPKYLIKRPSLKTLTQIRMKSGLFSLNVALYSIKGENTPSSMVGRAGVILKQLRAPG